MDNIRKEIQQAINLYKTQKYLEAELLSKKLIDNNPNISFLYNLLGLILSGQGKNDEAIKYYEIGINIKPEYAMIYNNLGTIYKSKKKYQEAEVFYKKSIKLDQNLIEAHNNLGNLYIDLNKFKEAIESFNKSISINSNFYVAHFNLGILYKSIGDFKKCKKCLFEAIKLYPKFYGAHRAYSQVNKYKINDTHINVMENLYNENNISYADKSELAFALGKAFDDVQNFKKAFLYYNEGNTLRRNTIEFSIKKTNKEFLNIKKLFNKNFFNKYKEIGKKDTSPIFIIGMPRSGTTLIEQIISSHPKVYGGDELNFFNDLIKRFFYKDKTFTTKSINTNIDENFRLIAKEYINKIKDLSSRSEKITDKLPINFKWIGFIKLILPDAKVVHCIRNPKDTCISIYKNYFTSTELNYAYSFDELINFYNNYRDLMKFWEKNLPGFITEIVYEDLIHNPKEEISNLINKCDLSWNENCLKFYNNTRRIRTASDTQVRNKLYKSSINSWKNYNKYLKKSFSKLKY